MVCVFFFSPHKVSVQCHAVYLGANIVKRCDFDLRNYTERLLEVKANH